MRLTIPRLRTWHLMGIVAASAAFFSVAGEDMAGEDMHGGRGQAGEDRLVRTYIADPDRTPSCPQVTTAATTATRNWKRHCIAALDRFTHAS